MSPPPLSSLPFSHVPGAFENSPRTILARRFKLVAAPFAHTQKFPAPLGLICFVALVVEALKGR